ncbi:hypothetical protein ACWD4J_38335 [Streptomyces sp. NPDC002577]
MRTAVIRINIDPAGQLPEFVLRERAEAFVKRAENAGIRVVDTRIDTLPAHRRELQLLMTGDDSPAMQRTAAELCAEVFQTTPANGVVTYISRGTDDDAMGVLAGLGITGHVSRTVGADGLDVVSVRLSRGDLDRVPESRIHTALEASLNCEVRIIAI